MGFLDATGVTKLCTELKNRFAALGHKHTAGDINSGTIATSRLPLGSTSAPGIVQLSNSTASQSSEYAATSSAVRYAWEKAMYGTSSTTASTAVKVVSCTNYGLVVGQLIAIQFSTANTYTSGAISLNINSAGAKNVYVNGAVTSSSNTLLWDANETLLFVYTGSYYYFLSKTKTVPLSTATLADMNNATATGIYAYSTSTTNHPGSTNGTVMVFRTSSTYIYQMAFGNNSSGNPTIYVRMQYSSGTWSTWKNLTVS